MAGAHWKGETMELTIRQLRLLNEKSQQEIADYLNIHINTYRLREEGKREFFFSDVYKLAKLFNVEINQIRP